MRHGSSTPIATRPCWSIPGCWDTSTMYSTSIRGNTSMWISRGAIPEGRAGFIRPRRHMERCVRINSHLQKPRSAVCAVLGALALALAGAVAAADLTKVLHVAFVAPENGFDPQATGDLYSNYVNREIFDPLYRYDYL